MPWKSQKTYFPQDWPTMIIRVDVLHAAPSAQTASATAMTMSVDCDATRYAAIVKMNSYRVEVLTPSNVHSLFWCLTQKWMASHEG